MDDIVEADVVEHNPSTLRRNMTVRNNAARQITVNFMPSRQLPYNTLRHRRSNSDHNALLEETTDAPEGSDAADKRADIIVREMEQHQRLLEDDPVAEEMRRAALRDLAQGLTMKRHVRAKLSASVSLRSKRRPISVFKRLKYRISFAWKKFKDRLRDFAFSIELWYEAIRTIEGQFGSAVGSYFHLVRAMFVADLVLAALAAALLVLPQAMHDQRGNETAGAWGVRELLSGKGGYADSLLFYGHYHDGDISARGPQYNMPFAYFFTMTTLYIVVFAVLCYRTAYSYRRNFIETSGGVPHLFASRVFCGWDFGIVSRNAAHLTAASIYNEFKELINEQNKKQVVSSFWTKVLQHLTNGVVTLVVLACIVCLEYGLWKLLVLETATPHWDVLVSLTVTLAMALLPGVFSAVGRLEYYSPRNALYVTLARTWLLDVGTLTLLMYYWANSNKHCWETSVGQEAYRLVLYDSLVSLLILPLFEFARGSIYKMNQKGSYPEFNLAYNSLTLIYNQAVLWLGLVFCPLLAAAVALKLFLLFYVKRQCALAACRPARKIWRAAQTQTVLYMLVTLSLFTTMFVTGSLFFASSSHDCGPFRGYSHVYAVLTEGALKLSQRPVLNDILNFLVRPGVIAFATLLLGVAVYYMRAKALAHRSMITILRDMLLLQAKDKEFLLAAIAKVSNGEWLYSPKGEEDEGPDSHTWRYLNEVRKPSNAGYHFDASRLSHSFVEGRPRSYAKDNRNSVVLEDGDTDSSFSWQGSSNYLHQKGRDDGKNE